MQHVTDSEDSGLSVVLMFRLCIAMVFLMLVVVTDSVIYAISFIIDLVFVGGAVYAVWPLIVAGWKSSTDGILRNVEPYKEVPEDDSHR